MLTKRVLALFIVFTGGAVLTPSLSLAQAPRITSFIDCRHNNSETAADRTRREQAISLARNINIAEARIVERTRNYVPMTKLGTLPKAPVGFELRFYSNAKSYAFSIKDTSDICHYAVFSDQDGLLYEKTPIDAQISSK